MSGIGVGVGVGLGSGSAGRGPSWLHARLVSIFGASLIGLYIGEDIVADESGSITSWPGRVGGTLTNGTVNRFSTKNVNGRRATAPGTIAENKSLLLADALAHKSVIMVAECTTATTTFEILCSYSATNTPIVRWALTDDWYSAAGWTHYQDGASSEKIPTTGVHVFEGVKAVTTDTGIQIAGNAASNAVWPAGILCVVRLDAVPDAAARAASLADLKTYCRLA